MTWMDHEINVLYNTFFMEKIKMLPTKIPIVLLSLIHRNFGVLTLQAMCLEIGRCSIAIMNWIEETFNSIDPTFMPEGLATIS